MTTAVGQALRSRPGQYHRPPPRSPANAPARKRRRSPVLWVRLWWPELAAGAAGAGWLWGELRPLPTVPTPAPVTLAGLEVWWASIVWPSAGEVAANLFYMAVVLAGVLVVDMVEGRDRRSARRLRWLWDRAGNGTTKLRRVRRRGGVFDARVVLRGGSWDALEKALDPDGGTMLRGLKLTGRWTLPAHRLGSPFRSVISTEGCPNAARARKLRLFYLPLPLPDAFPAYEQPVKDAKVFVGHTVEGPLFVDLDNAPHIQAVGETGSGKGQWLQVAKIQVTRARWLCVVLDGGGSSEHAATDRAPTWLRPMRLEMTVEARLAAAITSVQALKALMDVRSAVAEAFGVDRYADLPADVRAWLPPIGFFVDETTKLLSPSKADKAVDALRQQLAAALDTDALRNGRKFGLHVFMADQFAYSTVFSRGAQRQAAHVLVFGNMGAEHIRQVAGVSLPAVPDVPRCGHYIRFGNELQVREIRVPFDPGALRRAVEFVVAETGGGG